MARSSSLADISSGGIAASSVSAPARRFPIGAEVLPGGGVHFRLWARDARLVEVVERHLSQSGAGSSRVHALRPEGNGYHEGVVANLSAGALYSYRLNGEPALFPDPASRFQPDGVHGPSQVVDPSTFAWTDDTWPGLTSPRQVVYELHPGTFTPEGTWAAALDKLPALAELGVTVIEMMPIAEFPGRFGWGYDGVDLWAPTHVYGGPDDLRRFVDRCHALGMGVILDVVYNHLGPDGNYLRCFSKSYFDDRYKNEWGEAIGFGGEAARGSREFFVENAGYWIEEYHFDGLRLDATQCIFDESERHVLGDIAERVRRAGGRRGTYLVAENEPQHPRLVRPSAVGGLGLDALWNDDFHHTAVVALTGRKEAYYADYTGRAQELLSAIKWGYLFQGQRYDWQKMRRGRAALDLQPSNYVHYLENHDQVANSADGRRLHQLTSPARWRAMTALLLLPPSSPMLFQGQEFGSSAPFFYFADHKPDLAPLVASGRREFLAQFPSIRDGGVQDRLPDPADPSTFERCKLDWAEREHGAHAQILNLHRDLLRLRREDPALRRSERSCFDGAVLSEEALVLRFFCDADGERGAGGHGSDRLFIVNLGRDLASPSFAEPLLAPPHGARWRVLWSSEDPRYGGCGTPAFADAHGWRIPAQSALWLGPEPEPELPENQTAAGSP